MRHFTLAIATLALAATAAVSTAQADSYYGPKQVNGMCFVKQVGNSLGYWATCPSKSGNSAQARVSRGR